MFWRFIPDSFKLAWGVKYHRTYCQCANSRHGAPHITYSSSGELCEPACSSARPCWPSFVCCTALGAAEAAATQARHRAGQQCDHLVTWNDLYWTSTAAMTPLTLRSPFAREACCLSLTWAPAVMRARWSTAEAPGWGPRNPAGRRESAAAGCPVRRSGRHLSDGCGGGVRAASSLPLEWTWRF